LDNGSQARFALDKIKEFDNNNQQIKEDYFKIISAYKENKNIKAEDLIKSLNNLKYNIENL
jgi:ribosome-binding protein aMBF1 (putative translation factor)